MDEAVNYNRFLLEEVARWASGAERVLDFGAGNGRFAIGLHEMGRRVGAVEPDPELRATIAAAGVSAYPGLAAVPAGDYDAAYTINVLEHIDDDLAVLRELFERLVPGGGLFVYVPAFNILFSGNDARVGHLRRYRRDTLTAVVRDAGFEVEAVHHVDSIGFVAGLAYRLFGDRDGDLNVGAVKLYDAAVFPVSRAIDRITGGAIGKNLLLTARRP